VSEQGEANKAEESVDETRLPLPGRTLAPTQIAQVIEAALLAAEGPLTVDNLFRLFAIGELDEEEGRKQIRLAIESLQAQCAYRGVTLQKVASGYRYQTRQELSAWVSRLWEEKPPRYTRALLETLALIAYKQPVTRGDIEQVRGVSVSQNIMRTLLERDWIRVVGQREAPGRPSMYGTTKAFLDYFDLAKLDDLPPLEEIKAMIEPALVAEDGASVDASGSTGEEQGAAESSDAAQEADVSASPEAEQSTHS
jgi:segregation and condensation protein B